METTLNLVQRSVSDLVLLSVMPQPAPIISSPTKFMFLNFLLNGKQIGRTFAEISENMILGKVS